MRLAPALAALALTVAPLTACSFSVGGGTVEQAEVEQQVSTRLGEQVGQEPDDVTCPDDLEGEEGASMTCVLAAEGVEFDVEVVVTSVEDDRVEFDIQVADTPN